MIESNGDYSITDEEMIERAKEAREAAHAPYSGFEVGAAVLTSDGRVYTGCNIENSTYSLTMCAERVAIFKAVSEGAHALRKVAVVADHEKLTPPCGCCRQMIWEFAAAGTEVILANMSGKVQKYQIEELFPQAFDSSWLQNVR